MTTTEPAQPCESCGDDILELVLVQRLYLTPEAWDTPGSIAPGDEEWWCSVCRLHYPHVAPGDEIPTSI